MLKKTMIPGILGMTLVISALLCSHPQGQRWLFFLGAIGMTLMALLEKHKLFIGADSGVLYLLVMLFLLLLRPYMAIAYSVH